MAGRAHLDFVQRQRLWVQVAVGILMRLGLQGVEVQTSPFSCEATFQQAGADECGVISRALACKRRAGFEQTRVLALPYPTPHTLPYVAWLADDSSQLPQQAAQPAMANPASWRSPPGLQVRQQAVQPDVALDRAAQTELPTLPKPANWRSPSGLRVTRMSRVGRSTRCTPLTSTPRSARQWIATAL